MVLASNTHAVSTDPCFGTIGGPNLLSLMGSLRLITFLFTILFSVSAALAQSAAALQKLELRYGTERVEEMRVNAHYRYAGMLVYYSSSFLVNDSGQLRAATEEEIALIDLPRYDALRSVTARVTVHDADLQKDLVLLGRDELEQVMMQHLNAEDAAAYLEYKSVALRNAQLKQP